MSRDPYRASANDVSRVDRWDRDRFTYERDRDRFGDERVRFEEDDRYYARDPRGPPTRMRERSVDEDFQRRFSGGRRGYDDELVVRDRRFRDDDRFSRRAPSPPTEEFDRKITIDRERLRSPSPQRRPGFLRRQSSLDTFDRRPRGFYEREEYGPPARREDFRPPPNVPIPLPRSRALPPPRRYAEREFDEEIRVSDPDRYGDEGFHPYGERVREKEIIRTRQRDRSRESRTTRSHRGSTIRSSSRSSSTSRTSSSSGGTTVRSEYPKKGKTRIPARLVSEKALIDLRYPFIKEGNTIIVQMALGQENIDDLLKLSEDYKKSEVDEVITVRDDRTVRDDHGTVIEERREEFFMTPAHPPPPPTATLPPPPTIIEQHHHHPPPPPPPPVEVFRSPPPPVEVFRETVVRDVSPARSYTTTTSSTSRTPVVVDARPREVSEQVPVGPLALVTADRHHHHSRHRSHSRGSGALYADVHRHSDRELVTAERLSNGELVLYEERVEKIEEPRRGVRIEKDKKGPPPGLVRAMLATLT